MLVPSAKARWPQYWLLLKHCVVSFELSLLLSDEKVVLQHTMTTISPI
jgi:hypothetical protein